MEKGVNIGEIGDGMTVTGVFLVKSMSRLETKNGKPYLSLQLMDKSGEIPARVWDNADVLKEQCPAGAFVAIGGQAESFRDSLQLRITSLLRVEAQEVDPALFLPAAKSDPELLWQQFGELLASIEAADYRCLLAAIFADPETVARFRQAPAAKNMHHAYIGGLLEHTVAVSRLADLLSRLYPAVDRDLLIAGAMLHDLGKIEEFSFDAVPFDYSDSGRLEGHLSIGVAIVRRYAAGCDITPLRLSLLIHLILSHHGRLEFGSPVVPMTLEAFFLNGIDDLDAKANYLHRLAEQADPDAHRWTDYQKVLERFLFVRRSGDEIYTVGAEPPPPARPAQPPRRAAEKPAPEKRQPSLFD
ncbi:MAG: HD domain-containing protein [Thermodesulfobacteriota bacterium]